MAKRYQLPEVSARLSTTNKPSYHQHAVQAERVAKAIPVPQSSRTGDMSPAMRETLGQIGTAGQLAGKAMSQITQQISQRDMTQYQKNLQSKVDKMNDIAGKMGDQRDQMSSLKGEMDALQTTLDALSSLGCAAKDELDKYQKQFDDAQQKFNDANKGMQKASDQLNRAQQDLKNQMNKSYPNTSQGRRQDFLDERAAREQVNNAELGQSTAQGNLDRAGYDAYQAEQLRNQSASDLGKMQGQIDGAMNQQNSNLEAMQKQQADYMNSMRDLQTQQREFAQTTRDMYETALNQAKIAQGGNTLGATGSLIKDIANSDYWKAGANAANQTLDWAKFSGSTGAFTPAVPLMQNILTATAQAADRGANGYGITAAAADAVYGHTNLMAGLDMQLNAAKAFAAGDIGSGLSLGMQSAYPLGQSIGTTAQNVLPFTPLAAATPFAKPMAEGVGQGIASMGRSAGMMDIYLTGDRLGNAFSETALSPLTAALSGAGQFAEAMTGIDGLSQGMETTARDLTTQFGDFTQKNIVDDLFKERPNTSEQMRLDNKAKEKTGNPYNTKNPQKSNPKNKNDDCPKPIKPRLADTGTGAGNPYT